MKKFIFLAIILIIAFAVAIVVIGRTFYPDNVAETAPGGGRKGLETRYYEEDIAKVRDAAKDVIINLSSWGSAWKLVDQTDGGSVSTLKAEVPVVVFTDDLEVTIRSEEGKTRVDVRSASRVGKSDFGENARHVTKFLDVLDQRFRRVL